MFTNDEIQQYLQQSIEEAEKAFKLSNYPIGSVFINNNKQILTTTYNQCTSSNDITAHAEIIGIRNLGDRINKHSNSEHYLFSSLEPCFGCSFFIARTNIKTVYSALKDPHKGGISDLSQKKDFSSFFQSINIINEPHSDLAEKSRTLMRKYFQKIGRPETAQYYNLPTHP